jgi:SAM-dependent methyltransferase
MTEPSARTHSRGVFKPVVPTENRPNNKGVRMEGLIGYWLLRKIAPRTPGRPGRPPQSELVRAFGLGIFDVIAGKRVIDFGCGLGLEAIQMAAWATHVTGVEIQPALLAHARQHAPWNCKFVERATGPADVIVSKDAFEHFSDPLAILQQMRDLLAPGGVIVASFGPPWLHPYGGHLFSVFPWAHLLFSEAALIRWRSDFKTDGATRFGEVEGGLNQMTIARFERLVSEAGLRIAHLETVPIKGLRFLRWQPFREFGSSLVRCRLERQP